MWPPRRSKAMGQSLMVGFVHLLATNFYQFDYQDPIKNFG